MGSNQSKQIHHKRITTSTTATSPSAVAPHTNHGRRSRSPHQLHGQQEQPTPQAVVTTTAGETPHATAIRANGKQLLPTTEPPSSALSGCTTRHGTADPTMSSNYNDTTTPRSRRSSSSARQKYHPCHNHHYSSQQHQRTMDSGYSGSRWSSTLFSHAPQTTSSSITTVSTLSWICVQEEEEQQLQLQEQQQQQHYQDARTNNAIALITSTSPGSATDHLLLQQQLQSPPPYYCYPHPEVDEHDNSNNQRNNVHDEIGVSTERVLQMLERSPQDTYRILDYSFAKARLLQDSDDQAKAFHAALRWSQREPLDDDDNSNDVAAVWVARCYMDGFGTTKNPVAGFAQLKILVDRGCWQAFYPLAMCYLEGVRNAQGQVVQPVDKEIAYQWFSTVAQLDLKNKDPSSSALPIIALAQFRVGSLLVDEDPKAAFQWFLKSATRGNMHAQYIVGVHYEFGIQVNKDLSKAKEYMLESAMQDFAHAQAALGILLVNAHEYEEGILWLERAASTDNPRALFRLGLMYEEGIGVEQSNETAAFYFKAAANRDNAAAQFQLAIKYHFGGLGLRPNAQEADRYLRMSAKAGYSRAQRHLGLMYLERGPHNQHRHNKNNKLAVEWFFRAAAQGDVMAYVLVGECFEHGRGVEANHATALEYYTKAASISSIHQGKAQLATAELMLKHRQTADAFGWFVRASKSAECIQEQQQQDTEVLRSCTKCRAKLMVARYYLHGWGNVQRDQQRAYLMLHELADANDRDYYAHYWLATCYLEGIPNVCEVDHATAYKHYRMAAEMGYVEAEFQVGLMLSNGTGVSCDRSEAFEWYRKAGDKDYHPALYNLGLWHLSIKDMPKAAEYFEKAAYLGNAAAMEGLASIYLKESSAPVSSLDRHRIRLQQQRRKQAIQWFKKAAELGNRTAQRELGKLHGTGQGIARNYERAFGLFGQAAAQNDPEATLLLGSYYEQGRAVEKDAEHALRLYLKAGRLGSPVAPFAAGQLYHLLNRHQEAYAQYRIAAQDTRLNGEMVGKSATLMLARYILSYIPVNMENDGMLGNVTKEQAFTMLERLATVEEFVPAFYWLGDCFQHGRGTPMDLTQALMWFQRSVDEAQDVDAIVQLAGMYDQGTGVAINKRRAFDLYRQAAEHNHAEGQYHLGLAHWRGLHGMIVNQIEATRWFTLSAAQGFGESHWAMGQMAFEIGDHHLAREHWEHGRRLEHPLCIRSLAQLLLNNEQPSAEQATELLTQAVMLGDLDSLVALGRVHHTKATVAGQQFASLIATSPPASTAQKDADNSNMSSSSNGNDNSDDSNDDTSAMLLQQQQEALESATQCFEQAAMTGHVEAMFLAGQIWHEQKQYAAAHEYYDRAANQGHLLSRVMRARYRLAGGLGGVEADPKAGYQELMECAQMDNGVDAYHSIGQCYELGLGIQQDYQEAFEWYVRSAEATGDAEALVCIGRLFANRSIQHSQQHADMEAMQWFKLACVYDNHSKAHYQLGMYYLQGIRNESSNDNEEYLLAPSRYAALQHFEQAALQQDRDAMFQLANLFLDLDASDAVQWMDRAAQLGSPDALRELGKLYYAGRIVDQDFERAFDLFLRAAQLDDADAAMLVGKFYEHGITMAADLDQARYWYELAIQAGHGWAAELALALLLHRAEDQGEAYLLFRAAAVHAFTPEQRMTPDIMIALYHLHGWGNAIVQEEPAVATLLAYARAGHARVYYQIARCYETGLGVQRDLSEAFRWYSQLEAFASNHEDTDEELDQDVTHALLRLAEFHRHGWKTVKNTERADQLLQLASERTL
ncbi:hypothetical protein BDB00DRAFT_875886 [Zychaea mexicana]|uniref:uncharacterized protein n=1 Tax=Zychaea mexicana TaxID=64656 RepID=UPI0022FF0744|nr:uncharacterized protein BDB00DRAFT_875886 [Zychaea mexicana]KAI9489918.1 hypothetical protein BDB00DRAFT_875886 [Zychaea mexicana]